MAKTNLNSQSLKLMESGTYMIWLKITHAHIDYIFNSKSTNLFLKVHYIIYTWLTGDLGDDYLGGRQAPGAAVLVVVVGHTARQPVTSRVWVAVSHTILAFLATIEGLGSADKFMDLAAEHVVLSAFLLIQI